MMMIRLLTSTVLGILIVGGFYLYHFLTTTDKLAVSQVEFEGLSRLGQVEVEREFADLVGQNILLVALEDYAARFDGHPRIRDAYLKRVLPNRVVCTVREREPVALVYSSSFHEVDAEGMIMTRDKLTDLLDLPVISGLDPASIRGGTFCGDSRLGAALDILRLCKQYGGKFAEEISELRVGESGISIVSLKEGMVLLLGESEHEGRLKRFFLMRNTIARRDEAAKFIDLRFEDQIVLRRGI